MNSDRAMPAALLVHDGELADVQRLLETIGTPYTERRGALHPDDRAEPWGLVIATPARMINIALHPASRRPKLVAVLDHDSRTLRNSLRRAGIHQIVCRPVHPATLRALIVHALYQGPEKRRDTRVDVGAPIRLRVGWRRQVAVLADLSIGGCRLLTPHRLPRGNTLALQLSPEVTRDKAISVKARVLQSEPKDASPGAGFVTTARFEALGKRQVEGLKSAISAYSEGPAVFNGTTPKDAPDAPETGAEARETSSATSPPPAAPQTPPKPAPPAPEVVRTVPATPAPATTAAPSSDDGDTADAEPEFDEKRLREAAQVLEERMAALSLEADRVLMGRELSSSGMRVDPHPSLRVGRDVKLAIHAPDREEPLALCAKVHRDDGDDGVVLRFHAMPAEQVRFLNAVMDRLPVIDMDTGGSGQVVTELLEAG